jgi:flagellar biosynthesis protein FliP
MGAVAAQRHNRLKLARQALELTAGEEVDEQALFRAFVVGDRKAAFVIGFDDLVVVFDLR